MKSLQIKGTKAYCYDPKYKKLMTMGNKIGDVFFKTVEEKHFMRVVGGYGLQYDAFACFEKEGIKEIEVLERHTGIKWLSKPKEWFEHGKISDYGRGKQIFLSLKYMKRKNTDKLEKAHDRMEEYRAKVNQDRLF
jgi:hypothetical protein